MLNELTLKNRSYRRFNETRPVTDGELRQMIESARLSASAGNLQKIRYALFNSSEDCGRIFPHLGFAAYLKDWKGPKEGERPTAYIVMMLDSEPDLNRAIDMGIAAEAILLTACEMGLGGCIFRNYSKRAIAEIVDREGYSPELVIALGEPAEVAYITEVRDGDVKYYRDENDRHAVPKLTLDELIIK